MNKLSTEQTEALYNRLGLVPMSVDERLSVQASAPMGNNNAAGSHRIMHGHPVEEVKVKHLVKGDTVINPDSGNKRVLSTHAQPTGQGYYRAETVDGEPVNTHGDNTVFRKVHLGMEGKLAVDGGEYSRSKDLGIAIRNKKMDATFNKRK